MVVPRRGAAPAPLRAITRRTFLAVPTALAAGLCAGAVLQASTGNQADGTWYSLWAVLAFAVATVGLALADADRDLAGAMAILAVATALRGELRGGAAVAVAIAWFVGLTWTTSLLLRYRQRLPACPSGGPSSVDRAGP